MDTFHVCLYYETKQIEIQIMRATFLAYFRPSSRLDVTISILQKT